jgi:hypothetical protein
LFKFRISFWIGTTGIKYMNYMNTLTYHVKEAGLIVAFAVLCIAGVAGIPSWPTPKTTVGYFTVAKNPYGVAVYQDGAHTSVQFDTAYAYSVDGMKITLALSSASNVLLTHSRDDIIFDTTGTLYTEPTQEQIDVLTQKTGMPLRKVETSERVIHLPAGTFYLVNPKVPGMLEFHTPNSASFWIDRDEKRVGMMGTTLDKVAVTAHDGVTL